MGTWSELKTLGDEYVARLPELYASRNFPCEVRGLFADWFEGQNWNFDEKNPENMHYANELLSTLMKKLDDYCAQHKDHFMSHMRAHDMKKQFSDTFGGKPQYFVASVRDILNEEKHLLTVKSMSNVNINSAQVSYNDCIMGETEYKLDKTSISPSLEELNAKVVSIDAYIKEYRNTQEDFVIQYQNVIKIDGEIQNANNQPKSVKRDQQIQQMMRNKQEVEQMVRGKAELLVQDRVVVMNQLFNIQRVINSISIQIREELIVWSVMLQKSLSGAPKPGSLDEIQAWFESLTDILWHFYSLAVQYKFLFDTLPIPTNTGDKEKIEKLVKDIVSNLTQVIMQSFVVDKQPPQVLKTQTKFQASVRLLVGSKLNLQMNCPEVTVSILSEKQCKELMQGKSLQEIGTCGQILNNKCMMEHNKGPNNNDRAIIQAEFKNLQLKNILRKDRKGQESVLEAKSALVFYAKLNISGGESLPVMVMSVPVVVVVHGNQIPNSEATILWDNMFFQPARKAFDVPESVTWKEMSIALNARWMLSNESELHPDHLQFLQEKIYSTMGDLKSDPLTEIKIPWASFNKESIVKGKNFTFWEWFFGAIEVVKKNLKEHWKFNCLEFMSKEMSRRKLLEKPPGTFLIRFSESDIGAVTIAWCIERNGQKDIWNLQPWSTKDFSIRSLADRIFDLPELTRLFPDISKEMAFGIFKTNELVSNESHASGYVDTGIIARILPSSNEQKTEIKTSPSPRMDYQHPMDYSANRAPLSPFNEALCDPDILGPATVPDLEKDDFRKMLEDVTQWTEHPKLSS